MNRKRVFAWFMCVLMSTVFLLSGAVADTAPCVSAAAQLSAPAKFSAKVYAHSVILSWKSVDNADAYKIYQYESSSKDYKNVRTSDGCSCRISGLKADTSYSFKVSAVKKSDSKTGYIEGKRSKKLTVTTKAEKTGSQKQSQTTVTEEAPKVGVEKDGSYTSPEDVAEYIHTFGTLPKNFITKKQAQKLGWQGGDLWKYADGKSIGGDRFGNYEGILPEDSYKECDVNYSGGKRGAERLIYSKTAVYYTADHYKTFEKLY